MTATVLRLVAEAWVVCAAIQVCLWAIAERTRNAGIVDVGWALAFMPCVVVYAVQAKVPQDAYVPLALVACAWSARLGGYLIMRGAATGPEEGRYAHLRAGWGARASWRFFVFFQAQAALTATLSLAFVVPFVATPWDGGAVRALGIAISVAGLTGEALADLELSRWRRDPANRGRVCDVGLWSWSRHPNYFFEWCVWVGYAVYGLAFAPGGLIALGPQLLIIASIFGVTGIPPTEAQSLRSRGDAYREYQKRVSRFVPLPPKPRGSDA